MIISKALIDKYNVPVPRYTSYPPATRFHEGFTEPEYIRLVEESNEGKPRHIAIYIHIPFCRRICFYCGCHACKINENKQVADYIAAIKSEIRSLIPHIDKSRKVSQIHYGGGTPNSIDVRYIEEINELICREFTFISDPEIAIECHPAYLDQPVIDRLLKAGFNRFSLGIQDMDPGILKTVNREPPVVPVRDLIRHIRDAGTSVSVNLDFIYGLPGQNVDGFTGSISQAIQMRPERMVTFSYAHVPWVKKHQRILEKRGIPAAEEKTEMFLASRELLTRSGYIPVGLDHYVLPSDELGVALKNHHLHRNFQGYCTRRTTGQVYAFGVSAISQLEKGYAQNTKELNKYIGLAGRAKLPVMKGYILSKKQIMVKEAITGLMCNKQLDFMQLAGTFDTTVTNIKKITGFSDDKLDSFMADGLVEFADNKVIITDQGSLFIRNIAAALDPEYGPGENKYSKSV